MEVLSDIGAFIGEILVSSLWGLYMIFSYVFTKLGEFFDSLNIPMLPSSSVMLRESFISGTFLVLVVAFILTMNISAFNLFRKDKLKAKKQDNKENGEKIRRISERRLLARCFFGGAIGGYFGMKICRHKTLKPKFTIGVGTMAVLQLLIYSFVLGFFGFWLYMS